MVLNEITYIFGAGASFKAMPLVKSFHDRFQIYLEFLERATPERGFIDKNKSFIREIKSHLSFDTYFKKLFHQKGREIDIIDGKYLLLLYFIFEHLSDVEFINQGAAKRKLACAKEYGFDPRYDALIAGLLKPLPGKCQFPCNINFVTWNYDLMLLYSLYNFLAQKDISFKKFIDEGSKGSNVFCFGDQIKIIHLNGLIKNETITGLGCISVDDIVGKMRHLIGSFGNKEFTKEQGSCINFSWENMSDVGGLPDFMTQAIEMISQSHTVIIIGYSFPVYNRLFDLSILNTGLLNHKDLYIRDPDAANIRELLRSDFKLRSSDDVTYDSGFPTIFHGENCDSFFIPPRLLS
jgi:hypothetical protein